jgi:hypothetical protein
MAAGYGTVTAANGDQIEVTFIGTLTGRGLLVSLSGAPASGPWP